MFHLQIECSIYYFSVLCALNHTVYARFFCSFISAILLLLNAQYIDRHHCHGTDKSIQRIQSTHTNKRNIILFTQSRSFSVTPLLPLSKLCFYFPFAISSILVVSRIYKSIYPPQLDLQIWRFVFNGCGGGSIKCGIE